MKRRDFLLTSVVAAAASTVVARQSSTVQGQAPSTTPAAMRSDPKHKYKLRYAPHFGMFKHHAGYGEKAANQVSPDDLINEIKFVADQGFTAFEDNGMRKRPKETQERIAQEMTRRGMEMGIFVANDRGLEAGVSILASGDAALREGFLNNIRESVEVAKRVNAKRVTLVVGNAAPKIQDGYQMANVIEAMKRASALCEPSGLVMVCEPLNIYRDHPGFFIYTNHQMYSLMKAVNSPSCKLLFDLYHTQVNEGSLISNMDRAWDEIGYIQTGDHPGRKEPGTGEVNYRNVLKYIHGKGYTGILGMEHGNSKPGKEGEQALIDAYIAADSF